MKRSLLIKFACTALCVSLALISASCKAAENDGGDLTRITAEDTKKSDGGETSAAADESLETAEDPATEETTTESTEATTTAAKENPYERFIEDYKKAISEQTDVWYYGPDYTGDTVIPPEGTQGLLTNELMNGFSYILHDIDNDGTDELIIGEQYVDGENYTHITVYGVVTMEGAEYKIVAAGWSRSHLEYCGGGMFVNSGSGGASLHIDDVYRYNSETKKLDVVYELITEYEGTDDDGLPIPNYSLFEGDSWHYDGKAYESSDASCHGQEAWDKYYSVCGPLNENLSPDLIDLNWTHVPIVR